MDTNNYYTILFRREEDLKSPIRCQGMFSSAQANNITDGIIIRTRLRYYMFKFTTR